MPAPIDHAVNSKQFAHLSSEPASQEVHFQEFPPRFFQNFGTKVAIAEMT
jgi:hypothetical protein